MNYVERKTYNWILRQLQITPEKIIYHISASPDFVVPSLNKSFEAKRLSGGQILIYEKQYEAICQYPDCKVVIWTDESREPIAIIPVSEIPEGKSIWNGIKIKVIKEVKIDDQRTLETIEIPGHELLEVVEVEQFRDKDGCVKTIKRLRHGGYVIKIGKPWEPPEEI